MPIGALQQEMKSILKPVRASFSSDPIERILSRYFAQLVQWSLIISRGDSTAAEEMSRILSRIHNRPARFERRERSRRLSLHLPSQHVCLPARSNFPGAAGSFKLRTTTGRISSCCQRVRPSGPSERTASHLRSCCVKKIHRKERQLLYSPLFSRLSKKRRCLAGAATDRRNLQQAQRQPRRGAEAAIFVESSSCCRPRSGA